LSDVTVGFDGYFKAGYWTPVTVAVENHGEALSGYLELETLDGDAVTIRYETGLRTRSTIGAGKRTTITAYVKFGRLTDGLTVRLRDEEQVLAERRVAFNDKVRPAASTSQLIVTVGNDIGVGDALKLKQGDASRNAKVNHAILEPTKHHLPDHWIGYESVDTLVLATSQVETDDSLIGRKELRAIETWVKLGGRLILCADQDGHRLLEPSGPLATLLPGEFERTASLSSATGLETYVGATQPLALRRHSVKVAVLKNVRGTVESSERIGGRGQPIIVRGPHGLGHVLFVALNLDATVFRDWPERPRLVAELLSRASGRQQQTRKERRSGKASHLGYQDMTGQLRAALDQFEGVRPLAFSAIVAMIFAYILLIGPGDYFFLRKFARRMEWTWLSFAVLVAGSCGLVFALLRSTQSEKIHVNYVEVIDIDAESGLARGTVWTHVYSPSTEFYNLRFHPRVPRDGVLHDVLLSWHGLPGRGLNAMDTGVPAVAPRDDYEVKFKASSTPAAGSEVPATARTLRTQMQNVPIHTASSKTFLVQWWASLEDVPSGQLNKNPLDSSLQGELTNPLDVELSECIVLFDKWAYRLDRRLAAGETISVEEGMVEKTIEGFLNDRRVIGSQDVPTPWDTASLDIGRIMEVMLFFRAAGGFEYTNLTFAYQNVLDMSEEIAAGRAVLFGRAKRSFGRLEDDGRPLDDASGGPRQWTLVRVVLPVASAGGKM